MLPGDGSLYGILLSDRSGALCRFQKPATRTSGVACTNFLGEATVAISGRSLGQSHVGLSCFMWMAVHAAV